MNVMGFLPHQAVKNGCCSVAAGALHRYVFWFEIEILPEALTISMMSEKDLFWRKPRYLGLQTRLINVSHICSGHF